MTAVELHARDEVFGPALPTTAAGQRRPLLAPNRPTMAVHYVGSGTFVDSGDTPSEMRAIQAWASSPAKATPWEYNYVVDSDGEIWTYAGEYQAAHSAGNNSTSIGCLALVGTTDPVTDAMVLGLRKLRRMLQDRGLLSPTNAITPHRQLPGANTSCPGPHVLARWAEIAEPWTPPAPIVTPPPPPVLQEDSMLAIYQPTFPAPAGYDPAWFVVFASGCVRRATNPDVVLAGKLGVPTMELDSADQYRELLRASGSTYPTLP